MEVPAHQFSRSYSQGQQPSQPRGALSPSAYPQQQRQTWEQQQPPHPWQPGDAAVHRLQPATSQGMQLKSPPPPGHGISSSGATNMPGNGQVPAGSVSAQQQEQQLPCAYSWLFNTPQDLVCPITQEIFRDPVINCVGQVYERASIMSSLRQSRADPITRLPLADTSLTPVFVLRSRALEYRQSAGKGCLDAACSPQCLFPALMLRRAVELVGDEVSEVTVPGLSKDCILFVQDHQAFSDDASALQKLALGLVAANMFDEASNIYVHCLAALQGRADSKAKAAALQQAAECLSCQEIRKDSERGDRGTGAVVTSGSGLEKLAYLVEGRCVFKWSELIDITDEAWPGGRVARDLCEQVLARAMAEPAAEGRQPNWAVLHEVLLKFTKLGFSELDTRQTCLETESKALQSYLEREQANTAVSSIAASDKGACCDDDELTESSPRRRRVIGAALCAAAFLLDGKGMFGRAARVLPLLFALNISGK